MEINKELILLDAGHIKQSVDNLSVVQLKKALLNAKIANFRLTDKLSKMRERNEYLEQHKLQTKDQVQELVDNEVVRVINALKL